MRLSFDLTPPYDVDWMLAFLARRAVAGLERVHGRCYERVTPEGALTLRFSARRVEATCPARADADDLTHRLRAMLGLDVDARVVDAALARDPDMAERIAAGPGLRVPGAWDVFELGVRALLGQQVSVERGTALVARLLDRFGRRRADGTVAFPDATTLAESDPAVIGIPGRRAQALRAFAAAVAAQRISGPTPDASALRDLLTDMPGVGPWTREYVAMRAGRDGDAFPEGDWVVLRELGTTPAGARRRAELWRPWRAYAVMYLWAAAARRKESR